MPDLGAMLLDHPGRDGRGPVSPAIADVGEDGGDLIVGQGEGDHARGIDINSKGVVLMIDGDVVPEATDLDPDQVFCRTHYPFRGSEGWSSQTRDALTTVSVTGKAGEVSLLSEFHLPGINGVPDGRRGFPIRLPVSRCIGLGAGFRWRPGCLVCPVRWWSFGCGGMWCVRPVSRSVDLQGVRVEICCAATG